MQLFPPNPILPAGTELMPPLAEVYSDQSLSFRYLARTNIQVTSTDTNVVSVTDPLHWALLAPGIAQVVVQWSGLFVTNRVTVFQSVPVEPTLTIRQNEAGQLALSWPSWASDYILEENSDLGKSTGWRAARQAGALANSKYYWPVPLGSKTEYYRLRR